MRRRFVLLRVRHGFCASICRTSSQLSRRIATRARCTAARLAVRPARGRARTTTCTRRSTVVSGNRRRVRSAARSLARHASSAHRRVCLRHDLSRRARGGCRIRTRNRIGVRFRPCERRVPALNCVYAWNRTCSHNADEDSEQCTLEETHPCGDGSAVHITLNLILLNFAHKEVLVTESLCNWYKKSIMNS